MLNRIISSTFYFSFTISSIALSQNEIKDAIPTLDSLKPLLTLDFSELRNTFHPWRKYIGDYRSYHNFSFSFSYATSKYDVSNFHGVEHQQVLRDSVITKFLYTFYLPISGSFGYFLGSGFGVEKEMAGDALIDSERNKQNNIHSAKPIIEFPGLVLGLNYNFSPLLRMNISSNAYIERITGLESNSQSLDTRESVKEEIATNMRVIDLGVGLDYFYNLNWALKFEYHEKNSYFQPPSESAGTALDIRFRRVTKWWGFGLVYHLI